MVAEVMWGCRLMQHVLNALEHSLLHALIAFDTMLLCHWREGQLQRVHHVLNECLVDRGASPNMVTLEAYVDGHHITTVQVITTVTVTKHPCLWPSSIVVCLG